MTHDKRKNALAHGLIEAGSAVDLPVARPSVAYWILLVLSLAPIFACVVLWGAVFVRDRTPHCGGGPDLSGLVVVFYLFLIGVAHGVSSLSGIIGLCYVWLARRRFDRTFGWVLAVNVAMVAIPVLAFVGYQWHEKSISLVAAVESRDSRRLESLLATRQRPPHPNEAHLAMMAAVDAGDIEMVVMLVHAYREKWPRDTVNVNTYESALSLAVVKGKVDLVRALLERGADPNKRRYGLHNEKSILDVAEEDAKQTHDSRIVQLLRSHGAK
ncbi:MAG: ankyrin repeat domain-containing protein [Thermoguttaceae bacterium]